MKKVITEFFIVIAAVAMLGSCNTADPRKCFDVSVLNTNLYVGFADRGFLMQFEHPGVKLVEGTTDQTATMKRVELLTEKIQFAEKNLAKIKAFRATEDSKEVIAASIKLHEFMIPVYKNEYLDLAEQFDSGAPAEQIQKIALAIEAKYSGEFNKLYDDLIRKAKPYASRNNIKVHWGDEHM